MNFRIILVASFVLLMSAAAFFSNFEVPASASTNSYPVATPTPAAEAPKTAFAAYRGVTVGMPRADARTRLGEAKEKSDQQDYYVISEGETTQIVYDESGKVKTISTSYFGEKVKPPTAKDILGTDVDATADGGINKLVKYPKVGIWISYVRTSGSDPMVMITIQKMSKDES